MRRSECKRMNKFLLALEIRYTMLSGVHHEHTSRSLMHSAILDRAQVNLFTNFCKSWSSEIPYLEEFCQPRRLEMPCLEGTSFVYPEVIIVRVEASSLCIPNSYIRVRVQTTNALGTSICQPVSYHAWRYSS